MCLQFNFVGRILGPRGLTAKQLEAETGCKIMVRGKGSMRDKKKVSFSFHFSYCFFQKIFYYLHWIDNIIWMPMPVGMGFVHMHS